LIEGSGEGQVFHFDRFGIKYGTDDKGHAAALILSVCLLGAALLVSVGGIISSFSSKDLKWMEILSWIGNAFLFTAGIAVGKSKDQEKKSK